MNLKPLLETKKLKTLSYVERKLGGLLSKLVNKLVICLFK